MASLTDDIIKSQKEFEKGIADAKKEQAACEKAYKDANSLGETVSSEIEKGARMLRANGEKLEAGLQQIDTMIKSAEELLKRYDMVKRRAKEAEDNLQEMEEQQQATEKAAKANKGDKEAQKKAEVAAKALQKSEKERNGLSGELDAIEKNCKDPLALFKEFDKADWTASLQGYKKALGGLKDALNDAAEADRKIRKWW